MNVCDDCQSEDIIYEDWDGMEQYCEDCYKELDKEYIKCNRIKKI